MPQTTVYCSNKRCPFWDCRVHMAKAPADKPFKTTDLEPICSRFIKYVKDKRRT